MLRLRLTHIVVRLMARPAAARPARAPARACVKDEDQRRASEGSGGRDRAPDGAPLQFPSAILPPWMNVSSCPIFASNDRQVRGDARYEPDGRGSHR